MPSSEAILSGVRAIANDYWYVAVLWHVLLGVVLVAAMLGWRPSRRNAAIALAALPASVGVFATASGNPFNAAAFFLLCGALLAIGRRLDHRPLELGPAGMSLGGIALIAVGWAYPHFLDAPNALAHLVAAPLGIIPCPTLAALTGITLLADGFGSRAWSLLLAGASTFYGIVGVAFLGVGLDIVLVFGAALLAARSVDLVPHAGSVRIS